LVKSGIIPLETPFLSLMPFDVTVIDLLNVFNTFVVALQANTEATVTRWVALTIGTEATHSVEADLAEADFIVRYHLRRRHALWHTRIC
jgi:hypothetical protein